MTVNCAACRNTLTGIQFDLYLTGVSVPLWGTSFAQTPAPSGVRSIIHFICFLFTLYFGFISKPRSKAS
jgi:hypothetical protein